MNKLPYLMIVHILAFSLISCIHSSNNNRTTTKPDDYISYCCIQDSYPLNDKIEFEVSNNTNEQYWLRCAVEAKAKGIQDDNWILVYESIYTPKYSKQGLAQKLMPKQKVRLMWKPDIEPESDVMFDKYRFKLIVDSLDGKRESVLYTNEFMMN